MGLKSLFTRHTKPAPPRSPAPLGVPAVVREPLTPEQLADLDSARGEFLHVAGEAGLNYVHAYSLDGSRWQDDPEAVRAITALIKEILDSDTNTPTTEEPGR
ncbi:hypothetical protein [Paenarthrobacter sp. NPDC058040]|uniref:hypothetical protein n=1 Tax=unclassified Paenarthrobacter TaxID=2634190 RepID=UPI0036D8AEB3